MSGWNLSEIMNLNIFNKPVKEAFSFPSENSPIGELNTQLRNIAPSVGIDLSEEKIQGPPNTPSYSIPSFYDPNAGINSVVDVNNLDTQQEQSAWDMYTDLVSNRDIKQLQMTPGESFCKCNNNDSDTANTECGKLSEYKCKNVGCCIFTSNNKCVAGNKDGPTGIDVAPVDYYYYKNKCYGKWCPEDKKCTQ